MLKFHSSMLCTSRIHPSPLGNYLRTSLIIGNFMIIRVTSVEWTSLELEGLFNLGIEQHDFGIPPPPM